MKSLIQFIKESLGESMYDNVVTAFNSSFYYNADDNDLDGWAEQVIIPIASGSNDDIESYIEQFLESDINSIVPGDWKRVKSDVFKAAIEAAQAWLEENGFEMNEH